jgi:16S rRNA (guanine966-N2)-methyltransferase
MRIIGGSFHRRVLRPPAGLPVRPTTDKAKEALFNILNNYIDFEDIYVLDLFAGTGSIAFEFASRGAKEVLAVDRENRCVRYMQQVKQQLGMSNLKVIKADAIRMINTLHKGFDIVFCDPPYDMAGVDKLPDQIFSGDLLLPEAVLIIEHDKNISFDDRPNFLFKKNYSKVHFSFFRFERKIE